MSSLDLEETETLLTGTIFAGKLHHFDTIDSTNARAVAAAQAGAEAGQVYIADLQTAGRGRGGHTWQSTAGDGLYMSLLLRPNLRAADALKLSLAMGLVAQNAIAAMYRFHVDLRWPNDIVTIATGLKLGGILTESASDPAGRLRYAVIGIGLNLNQTAFDGELARTATSLRIQCGEITTRERLIAALLTGIATEALALEDDPGTLLVRFENASTWAQGKQVQVAEEGGYAGVTTGLTGDGLLRVRLYDGVERIVRHGGVREIQS